MKEKDPKWENCKQIVDKRDKRQCQLLKCLSVTEFHQLKDGTPKTADRCHIFCRSVYPKLIYNSNNIITLSRFIHRRMDDYCDPISGENIDSHYHYYWWYRIYFHLIEKYDSEKDYEQLLLDKIDYDRK